MKKKFLVITLMLLLFAAVVSAQNADAVSKMLEADEITVGDAAYFLAVYIDAVSETSSASAAVSALQEKGICLEETSAEMPLTYKVFSGMLMRTWDEKGGLMYSITGADRYALRDLQAKGIISSGADPLSVLSGYDALAILNNCMMKLGGN